MMHRLRPLLGGLLAALVSHGAIIAQVPDIAPEQIVELPPMLIEDSAKLPPWLYVKVDGAEYLSRCTSSTTRGYIEARLARMQLLQWLVPPEFFVRMDVPSVTVLTSQKLRNQAQDQMVKEVMELRRQRLGSTQRNTRASSAPNMMLDDRDLVGVFAYINEQRFEPATLTVAADYVEFLLERRTPRLPEWLQSAILQLYGQTKFDRKISIDALTWLSTDETIAIAANPAWPRTLVAAADFFSPAVWRMEAPLSKRGRTLRAQSALFLRWALDPQHGARDAFWRFAARAAEEPVTEEMFEQHFGFGFSDWRDRMSDFLPEALSKGLVLTPGKLPAIPRVRPREATPSQVSRLQGEWERLSIAFVRRRHPDFTDRYAAQALGTLHSAYTNGDRDPQLFATLGLCEIDAGNETGARDFLERAAAGGVTRPRAYYELARLRFADVTQPQANESANRLTAAEVNAVVEPVRRGLAQKPVTAGLYSLLAETWTLSASAPPQGDWALLTEGARHFVHEPWLIHRLASVFGQHGKKAEAVALLGKGFPYIGDDATRKQFADLYTSLTKASAP